MSRRNIKWLHGELPKLVSRGVLAPGDAQKLKSYYGEWDESGATKMALAVFGVLGAILISAGIILLLAKNWEELTRPMRTVIALIPLVTGQLLSAFALIKRNGSTAWREGTASFLSISIGAAISLVGQTYNLSGDNQSFVLLWMLLIVPLVYLMDVTVPGLFYMAGITAWAGIAQQEGSHALLFWVLLGLLVPYVIIKFKRNPFANHSVFLGWSLAVTLCIAIGITLEKVLPGLWIIVYSSYFSVLYLGGSLWYRDAPALWQSPFRTVGAAGILVMSYMFTYEWPWNGIGWNQYRHKAGYHEWVGYFDYIIAACFVAAALYLIYKNIRKNRGIPTVFGFSYIIAIVSYIAASALDEGIALVLFNLYLLILGIWIVVEGVKKCQLGTTNGGMLIIALLAVLRFFDSDLGFAQRGIAFILVGIGFLVMNVLIIKRRKGVIQ